MENGLVKVVSPIDDTPADRAGIMANDLIVKLDGEQVQGLTLNEAVEKMRGPVNTPITLTIQREGREPFDVKLVRDRIRVQSVKFSIEADDIAYIRISSFTEQTQEGLDKVLTDVKNKLGGKLKGYIVDLRNNPGGLLDQAISVSDTFLDRGEVVSTRGRHADETQRFGAQKGDLADGKPIVDPDQRRLGLGFGNRRRRVAGPQAGDDHRYTELRQGLGADHHSAGQPGGAASHHGALLHSCRPFDPGQGHRRRHPDRAGIAAGA